MASGCSCQTAGTAGALGNGAVIAAALAGLSACYVVPIDPRTGQAYPPAPYPAKEPGSVTVVAPPAPSAPPRNEGSSGGRPSRQGRDN